MTFYCQLNKRQSRYTKSVDFHGWASSDLFLIHFICHLNKRVLQMAISFEVWLTHPKLASEYLIFGFGASGSGKRHWLIPFISIVAFVIFLDFVGEPFIPFGDVLTSREIDESGHEIGRIFGEINKTNAKIKRQHWTVQKRQWSIGYGWQLMIKRSWVRIPAPYTGNFSHWFVVKIVLFVWKDQNKRKEAGLVHF